MVQRIVARTAAAVLGFFFVAAAGAQEEANFTFSVNVQCEDATLRGLARSYFSRELREIKDVRMTTSGAPDYRIEAACQKVGQYGWVMSIVISEALDPAVAGEEGFGRSIHHSVNRGDSTEDMGDEIGVIIGNIDREFLKPIRKERKKK